MRNTNEYQRFVTDRYLAATRRRTAWRRAPVICLAVFGSLGLFFLIAWIAFHGNNVGFLPVPLASDNERRLVAEFHGNGEGNTPWFRVAPDWEIEWQSRDDTNGARQVYLNILNKDHEEGHKFYLSQNRHFGGSIGRGGKFRFEVDYYGGGEGPWRIRVYQRPNRITDGGNQRTERLISDTEVWSKVDVFTERFLELTPR